MNLYRHTLLVPLEAVGQPPLLDGDKQRRPEIAADEPPVWDDLALLPARERLEELGKRLRREGGMPADAPLEAACLLALVAHGPLHTSGVAHAVWVAVGLPGSERMELAKVIVRVIDRLGSRVVGDDRLVVRTQAKNSRTKGRPKDPVWTVTPAGETWMRRRLAIMAA
jgi:hypothetical protein